MSYGELYEEFESLASEDPQLANEVSAELLKNASFMSGLVATAKGLGKTGLSVSKKLAAGPISSKLATGAGVGALVGAGKQIGSDNQFSMGDVLKDSAIGAGIGAGVGAGMKAITPKI